MQIMIVVLQRQIAQAQKKMLSTGIAASGAQSERLKRYLTCKPRFASSSLRTVVSLHGTVVPHIYKNAGTALMRTVLNHGGKIFSLWDDPQGRKPAQVQQMPEEEVRNLWKNHKGPRAAIIRDPLERAASAFHEVMSRKHCEEDSSIPFHATHQKAMVRVFADALKSSENTHYDPQMQFLVDNNGHTIELGYIGLADNLLQEMASIFGLPDNIDIPPASGPMCGEKNKDLYRVDVTRLPAHVIRKACKRYAVDYCCLGLEFPPECESISCEHWFS